MNPSPPPPPPLLPIASPQQKIDEDHLKLLAIFHFVAAGLALVWLLYLVGNHAMMQDFFKHPPAWHGQKPAPPPPPEFLAIVKWMMVGMGIWTGIWGVLNLIAGFCLRARKHRVFSIIVSVVNCLHVPVGTVLGVFTLIILNRDSVREQYEAKRA